MNSKLTTIVVGLASLALATILVLITAGGHLNGREIALLLAASVIAACLFAARRSWVQITLGMSSFYAFVLPVFVLTNLHVFLIWMMILLMPMAADLNMRRSVAGFIRTTLGKGMIAFALIITIRLLADRPGSARLGESGGLGGGIEFFVAGWAFVLGQWLATESDHTYKRIGLILMLALVALGHILLADSEEVIYAGRFYQTPTWLIAAIVIATTAQYASNGRWEGTILMVLVVGMFTAIGASSVHRAFLVMPPLAALSVWLIYRQLARFTPILVGGVLALVIMIGGYAGEVPENIARPLSLLGMNAPTATYNSEFGWDSAFRADMYSRAWTLVTASPILGSGFGFRQSDLNAAMSLTGDTGVIEGLAVSRGFHNGLLTLAAVCGIPAAVLWLAISVTVLGRAGRFRQYPSGPHKLLAAVVMAYLVPATIEMLVNGGSAGRDMARVNLAIGVLAGLMTATRSHQPMEVPRLELRSDMRRIRHRYLADERRLVQP